MIRYVVDSSSLMKFEDQFPKDILPSLWDEVYKLFEEGKAFSVRAVYEELEDCIPTYSMEKEIEHNELVKELNMFLENLSKEKRVIFLERYWYMSSIKDIATKHSQKESKTKMELLRMRNALRKYLEERGEMV